MAAHVQPIEIYQAPSAAVKLKTYMTIMAFA